MNANPPLRSEPHEKVAIIGMAAYSTDRGRIEICSRIRGGSEEWDLRAEAKLRPVDVKPAGKLKLEADPDNSYVVEEMEEFYEDFCSSGGIGFGPAFRTLRRHVSKDNCALVDVALHESCVDRVEKFTAHPALLDGCLQSLIPTLWIEPDTEIEEPEEAYLPVGIHRVRCHGTLPAAVRLNTTVSGALELKEGHSLIEIADQDGNILITVDDLKVQGLPLSKAPDDDAETPADFVTEQMEEITLTFEEEPESAGRWLLLSDPGPETDALLASLSQAGTDVVVKGHDDLGENLTDALTDILSEGTAKDAETPISVHPVCMACLCERSER